MEQQFPLSPRCARMFDLAYDCETNLLECIFHVV
jgi:hypothetical protein